MKEPEIADRFPQPNESCVICPRDTFKRAALLFDRINYPWMRDSEIPEEVTFYVNKLQTLRFVPFPKLYIGDKPAVFRYSGDKSKFDPFYALGVSKNYAAHGIVVVPLFSSHLEFVKAFPSGISVAHEAAIQCLEVVSEKHLSWEQVLEFRKDKNAVRKYRNLKRWLQDCLMAQTVAEATNIIEKKIEDYQWSIKKHGLKTVTGALSSIFDSRQIVALSAGAGIVDLIGGPIWAAITAGFLTASKITIWLADRMIDLEDTKRGPNSEVALIYEARKAFGRKKVSK